MPQRFPVREGFTPRAARVRRRAVLTTTAPPPVEEPEDVLAEAKAFCHKVAGLHIVPRSA